jgi:hypothetical protein
MADQHPTIDIEAILAQCDPLIRNRIKQRLGVTLLESDGNKKNQDALDYVYGKATLVIIEEVTKIQRGLTNTNITNFRGYALVITEHKISEYLNRINPVRRSLEDKLRYCLETRQGYSLWRDDDDRLLCGLARWKFQEQAGGLPGGAAELRNNPDLIDRSVVPFKHLDNVKPDDWLKYLDAVFNCAAEPMTFDDLISITTWLLGIRDEFRQMKSVDDEDADDRSLEEPPDNKSLGPLDELLIEEYLRCLWAAIVQLKPLMRAVVLLNIGVAGKKMVQQTLTEIGLFPYYEIASKEEIGRLLAISDEQFNRLWNNCLEMDEESRRKVQTLQSYEEKFALLWEYLPLQDDEVIGAFLEVKPGNVRTARFRAVNDILRPRMKSLGYEF